MGRGRRILLTVLAIECGAVLIALGIRYQAGRDAAVPVQAQAAAAASAEDVSAAPEAPPLFPDARWDTLEYTCGGRTLRFSLNREGAWVWSDDEEFPLNDGTVRAILEDLSDLRPMETVIDQAVIAQCGFDDPSATLTASGKREERSLEFGNAREDGTRYVRYRGEETRAYVVGGQLFSRLETPIYAMAVLPELPALREDSLRTLSVRGTFAAEREEGAWRGTGTEKAQALLRALEGAALSGCLDFRPSKGAAELCGFSDPAAVIEAVYSAGGEERRFVMTLGGTMNGGRCVRLDDGETIYLLPEETGAAILGAIHPENP